MKLAWREAGLPFLCWFWEHDLLCDTATDSCWCSRCGMNERSIPIQDGMSIGHRLNVWWWNHIGWHLYRFGEWVRNANYLCDVCRKPLTLLGHRVGNHEDCWPF